MTTNGELNLIDICFFGFNHLQYSKIFRARMDRWNGGMTNKTTKRFSLHRIVPIMVPYYYSRGDSDDIDHELKCSDIQRNQ